jgi:GDPmannose 4,6-dehydratase
MWRILQADKAEDFVIATGEANSLQEFVAQSFAYYGLNWKDHVIQNIQFIRPNEIPWSQGNPNKALEKLGWKATKKMGDVIQILAESQGL